MATLKSRFMVRCDLGVTELAFGCSSIGGLTRAVNDAEAQQVLEAAWESGIRYFDTAPHYGLGLSEQRLGAFLAKKRSEALVVSTKVGRLLDPLPPGEEIVSAFSGALPYRPVFDYSYAGIMRSFEESCERLGGHVPDILYVHDIGRRKHGADNERYLKQLYEGGLPALQELKKRGTIRGFGLGVNEVDICVEVIGNFDLDVILLANRYTLIDRAAERGLLALCRDRGVDIIVGGVFNTGVLAAPDPNRATFDYRPADKAMAEFVAHLRSICEANGTDIVTAALNFPLRSPSVASVLVGTARISSLEDCRAKYGAEVPEALWREVDVEVAAHAATAP
jgi:D-threo-aldose 1-dehydrogenase